MLDNLSEAIHGNAVKNIKYREAYLTGIITAVNANGSYDVEINNSGKPIKKIFPNDPNIIYAIGNTVGIGWEDCTREKIIIIGILRNITVIEVESSVSSL